MSETLTADDLRDDLGQARSDLAQALAERLVDRGRAERAEAEAAAERERREAAEAALVQARTPWPFRLLQEFRRRL
jgi:uncharacterized protein (DUF3084 family)